MLSIINNIIFIDGGLESEAMKLLINSQFTSIYNCFNHNMFVDHEKIFKDIQKFKKKNALITLARKFSPNALSGHAYSVLGAWEFSKGHIKKKVLCIKNPWSFGNNQQENFDLISLNNSLEGFPELVEFNNKYFSPSKNSNSFNYFDYIIDNNQMKYRSSVFIAPLDYLMNKENGLTQIEAHLPNYKRDFPSVNLELDLYDKLDELFKMIQTNNIKNVYDSNIDGERTFTRVISIGEKNVREIISNIYNKNFYAITKNGQNYCELQKRNDGDYDINNISNLFYKDYADNFAVLTDNLTGEKKNISLNALLNSKKKNYQNYSLTIFNHSIQTNIIKPNNNARIFQCQITPYKNEEKQYILVDTMKPKTFTNFYIEDIKPKNTVEYKRINYSNGYYIGDVLNNKRHGKGKMTYNDGDYENGDWRNDNFISGSCKITYNNDDYYIGQYSNGNINGNGEYYYNNGDYYVGDFYCGKRHGKGKYNFKNGDYENGTFESDDFIEGKKKITYINGEYEGGWENNKKNGYGKEIVNGVTFKGYYINGKRHGKFERICTKGNFHEVEYEYGELKTICLIF